jgi:cyclase
MITTSSNLIGGFLALGLSVGAPFAATAQAADSASRAPFELKAIGPGVYAAIDGPEGKSGSNAGFVIGDDSVLVIDSFFDPAATRALIMQIGKLTDKPIRYVVNTHYHADHVGGDAVLRAAGAIIIAHRNVRGWIRTENLHLFGDHLTPKMKAIVTSLPLPDIVTDKDLTLWLGSRKVLVRAVFGHTGGDLIVGVPDAKIVFCGDILWNKVSPNIIDGTVARWIETLGGLTREPDAARTVFVPGHGDVASIADVAAFDAYLGDLRTTVMRQRAVGLSGAALVRAALPDLMVKYGKWASFGYFAPLELDYMDEELAGSKRIPTPVVD